MMCYHSKIKDAKESTFQKDYFLITLRNWSLSSFLFSWQKRNWELLWTKSCP